MKGLIYSMAVAMPYIAANSSTPAQATTAPHLQASAISPLMPRTAGEFIIAIGTVGTLLEPNTVTSAVSGFG